MGGKCDEISIETAMAQKPLLVGDTAELDRKVLACGSGEVERDVDRRRFGVRRITVIVSIDPAGDGIKCIRDRDGCEWNKCD